MNSQKIIAGFPEFWEGVHTEHRVYFEASALLQRTVNGIKQHAPSKPLHKIVRCLAIVGANSYGALITLVLNGYGNDAMKIARSIFEADVTAGYLCRHPEEVNDYLDYDCVRQKRSYDYMVKHWPDGLNSLDKAMVEDMLKSHAEVAPRFQGRTGWCKRSLRQRAEDLGGGLDQVYLTFYRWASDMHHVSMGGLALQIESESLDVDVAPSSNWLGDALAAGLGSIVRLAMRSNAELKLGLEKDLEQIHELCLKATAR